jgi:hypothetical protein
MAGTRYGATGANVTTETQEHRDERHAAMLRMGQPRAAHVDVVAVPPGDKAVAVPVEATAVTATVWQPLLISMARGVAEAFVLAALATFTMLSAVPEADARAILIVAGASFFGKLAAAFGFGVVDQNTATKKV